MLTIKTFKDSEDKAKNSYHVNAFGYKFRIATRTRSINWVGLPFTYTTGRGRVFNIGRKYICFMRGA